MSRRIILLSLVIAICPFASMAEQEDIRLNPEIEPENAVSESTPDYSEYPFINIQSNTISMNGADWSHLRNVFRNADSSVVRILHIGDSHVQAEGATSRIRHILQQRYGNAGRGLTAPLRLAGTNSPTDYSICSKSSFTTSRLLKRPWATCMGFSGVAIRPEHSRFDLTVNCGESFDRLRMYTIGAPVEIESTSPDIMAGFISPADGITDLLLTCDTTEISFNVLTADTLDIIAIELLNGNSGVIYSAIGNNGATFASYSLIPHFGEAINRLRPDLVVISLGTNEAFGRFDEIGLKNQIHSLVSNLQQQCPDATMLLTTPQECYRRTYSRRGKRRRRVRGYAINSNIKTVRNIISDYAAEHSIALYDWYEIAGGHGNALKWLGMNLMNKDRVHLTWDGYHLMGDLMGDALLNITDFKTDIDNESVTTY